MNIIERSFQDTLSEAAPHEHSTKITSTLISLFSGAGGLDLGFHQAGFNTIWANEYDKSITPSFSRYFPNVTLDNRSIVNIDELDIPKADGIIGGPPCQSWSEAGARRGINDHRGQLFYDYIRIIRTIKPRFFVAENVSGIVHERNRTAFQNILEQLENTGYDVSWKVLNAADYEVPQKRERVFIIGFRKDLRVDFKFPEPIKEKKTLKDAIYDLRDIALNDKTIIPNHETINGDYSSIFMSRNRVKHWDEQSYTILATDRHTPLHPQAPKMIDSGIKDKKIFVPGYEHLYRRLSVRECARIQTFPDDYTFVYTHPRIGYKMIGNAVPVRLAYHVANQIKMYLKMER